MDEFPLVFYPDPRLRDVAREVKSFDAAFWAKVERLFVRMKDEKGVGLAAPQVGWGVRVFVANCTGEPEDDIAFVNPRILKPRGKDAGEEGCLSFPDIRAEIVRPARVRCEAAGRDGKPFTVDADGLLARCIQHEHDHLEGVLFIDRMREGDRLAIEPDLRDMERRFKKGLPPAFREPAGASGGM